MAKKAKKKKRSKRKFNARKFILNCDPSAKTETDWGFEDAAASDAVSILPQPPHKKDHELGHVFGLNHPPGNSTTGSILEPSGFCAPNPALMSDLNCDNADNPLITTSSSPFLLCWRNTDMP